jgi:hypothetical protein
MPEKISETQCRFNNGEFRIFPEITIKGTIVTKTENLFMA